MGGGTDEHFGQLDGVRAVAVALVVWSHYERLGFDYGLDLGRLGVFTFFTLSGFLITGILLRSRDRATRFDSTRGQLLRSFYGRRVLRIFPLYYAAIAAGLVLGFEEVRANLLPLTTYTINVTLASRDDWFLTIGHFWSLAVEEQFYLVWPFVMLLLPRHRLLAMCIAGVLVAPFIRFAMVAIETNELALYVLPFMSIDALLIGGVFAVVHNDHPSWTPSARTTSTAALVALGCYLALPQIVNVSPTSYWWVAEQSLTTATGAGLVAVAVIGLPGRVGSVLASGPLTFLGRISYGIYVIHLLVPELTWKILDRYPDLWQIVADRYWLLATGWAALTVLLSWLSWTFLEAPFVRLKRHLPYVTQRVDDETGAETAHSESGRT